MEAIDCLKSIDVVKAYTAPGAAEIWDFSDRSAFYYSLHQIRVEYQHLIKVSDALLFELGNGKPLRDVICETLARCKALYPTWMHWLPLCSGV